MTVCHGCLIEPLQSPLPSSSSNAGAGNPSSALLTQQHAQSSQQACAQVIFELLDLLTRRLHKEEQEEFAAMLAQQRSSPIPGAEIKDKSRDAKDAKDSKDNKDSKERGRPAGARLALLESVPKPLLAQAAFRCKAYSRAIKYFEIHLREVREEYLKQLGPPVDETVKSNVRTLQSSAIDSCKF